MSAPVGSPERPATSEDRVRRVYVKSYGCQMNVYDSQRMIEMLRPIGYAPVESADDADLVILNTCHIREKATEKVYSELGRLKAMKTAKARTADPMVVAVTGCVAQAEGAEIMRRQPAVDLVVGPQSYQRLPELIARRHRSRGERLAAEFAPREKFDVLGTERKPTGVTAFLTIQEGCDKFCTFCVVPYTRGAEYSRPQGEILEEAASLVAGGVREITLLGQNVNAYRSDVDFPALIHSLATIPGLARIRYTTSHPRDMTDRLIEAHREVPALMPYLHLPVQTGSDRVLRAMNRGHTADDYLRIVDRLRAARPDIALSSDFIVGFPGESDADFAATLALVDTVRFASAFSFKYSPRPGTPAAAMGGQVPDEVKSERLSRLQAKLDQQQGAFNQALVRGICEVLFEAVGRQPGQIVGRTPWLQAVHCQGDAALVGDFAPVEITAAGAKSLAGQLVQEAA